MFSNLLGVTASLAHVPTVSDVSGIRANLVYSVLIVFTTDENFYASKTALKIFVAEIIVRHFSSFSWI